MAAHQSWLRTRQSLGLFLPCRRLPDRIREVLYRREMKMSEFWRSCSVSCGTSMFGLLWESSRRFLNPYIVIMNRFRRVSRWHSRGSRGTAWDRDLAHQIMLGHCRRRRKRQWHGFQREFGRGEVCRPRERRREHWWVGWARR